MDMSKQSEEIKVKHPIFIYDIQIYLGKNKNNVYLICNEENVDVFSENNNIGFEDMPPSIRLINTSKLDTRPKNLSLVSLNIDKKERTVHLVFKDYYDSTSKKSDDGTIFVDFKEYDYTFYDKNGEVHTNV